MKHWFRLAVISSTVFGISMSTYSASLETQVSNKIRRVKNLVNKIDRNIYYMSQFELRQANQKLRSVINTLKSNSTAPVGHTSDPYYPGDYSSGGYGQPQYQMTVSGQVEDTSFMFQIADTDDFMNKCTAKFKKKIWRVDDAKVSLNFAPQVSLHNSQWWIGEEEVCAVIAEKLVKLGLPVFHSSEMILRGRIEEKSFLFKGNNLGTIMRQCMKFYSANFFRVDDMVIFNGQKITRKHNNAKWWSSANDACNVLIQEARR